MPQSVVYVVFATPFVIFTVVLAVISIWSGRAPKGTATADFSLPDA